MASRTTLKLVLFLVYSLFLLRTEGCFVSDLILENGAYSADDGGEILGNGDHVSACCNDGFVRKGPSEVQCLPTGEFSEDRPMCEDINECDLDGLFSQYEEPSEYSSFDGASDYVRIEVEHHLQDFVDQMTCQARPLLPPINELCHSVAYCSNTIGSYTCICPNNYIGNGTHCKVDNIPCDRPSPPANGFRTMFNNGRYVEFSCAKGYRLRGSHSDTCRRGQWHHEPPTCHDTTIRCPEPEAPDNGRLTIWGTKVNNPIFIACHDGYDLIGPSERRCQYNRKWSGRTPRCKRQKTLGDVAIDIKKNFIDQFTSYTNSSLMRQSSARSANNPSLGLDIVLVYDRSSSLDESDFELVVNFTKQLISNFGVSYEEGGTRVAAVTFATTAQIAFRYSDEVDTMEKVFAHLDTLKDGLGGGTGMHEGLAMVGAEIEPAMRERAKHVLFLFTDGQHNTVDPFMVARDLREKQMEIFTVGVGSRIDQNALEDIASPPSASHFFHIRSFDDLEALTKLVNNSEIDYKPCGEAGNTDGTNNHVANEKAWPWLSIIHRETPTGKEMLCSGALLCRQWVVTTSSCFGSLGGVDVLEGKLFNYSSDEEIKVTATLGDHNISTGEGCEQTINVDQILLHDEYDYEDAHDYDIALLHLSEAIELNSCARTICLPTIFDSMERTVAVGWSDAPDVSQNTSGVPRQFELTRAANRDLCQGNEDPSVSARTLCAVKRRELNEGCEGDLVGSPLMNKRFANDKWALLGLATKGETCSGNRRYGIFTKISPTFIPWIHNVTSNCLNEHIPTY